MANFKLKIKLLIWKNLRIRRHNLPRTMLEIAWPLLLFLCIYFLQTRTKNVFEGEIKYYPVETKDVKVPHLFYTPSNTYINNIMESTKTVVRPGGQFRGFDTEADMIHHMFHGMERSLTVGVVFNDVLGDKLPRNLSYSIRGAKPRFNIELLYELEGPEYMYYWHSFFFPVQQAIDTSFIKQHNNLDFSISRQRMPMPPHSREEKIHTRPLLPMFIVLGLLIFMLFTTQDILDEKSTGMTELEKIMGFQAWILWLGWYMYSMMVLVPCMVGLTAWIKLSFYTQSDALIWALLLFFYCNSIIFYIFFVTTLFNKQYGLNWNMLFHVPNTFKMFHSVGKLLLVLLLQCFILALLIWYVGAVNPGQYGIPKPWNFCLQKKKQPAALVPASIADTRPEVEPPEPGLQAKIQIRGLYKKFGKTAAVNGLTLDIYSNQITVLVGPNGSGKTTTMKIICGMMEPLSGSVVVDGYNVRTQKDKIRGSLGLCPQHNVYIKYLSVQDHLMFFAMLKGLSKKEANRESLDYLQRLKMTTHAKFTPNKLSGGLKRRLSVGVALVGPAKVLILDEPTFGLNPENRREIWDILMSMRGSRTILITTNCMEEAEVLGDRIAIMHLGQLQCYGTSKFSKKLYDAGYTLTILLRQKSDANKLRDTINSFVPHTKVKHVSESYVTFELPTTNTATLTKLFNNLENEQENLGIINMRVSQTTMDEVFIKVCNKAEGVVEESTTVNIATKSESFTDDRGRKYNSGAALLRQQFRALVVKRSQYHKHKWLLLLLAILLPIFLHILLEAANFGQGIKSNVNMLLTLGMYPIATSYYSRDNETSAKLASYYEKAVREQHSTPVRTEQVTQEILNAYKSHKDRYENLITAAELNTRGGKMVLNVMFHSKAIHSCAISLNLVTNALLKYALDDDTVTITVRNNPQRVQQLGISNAAAFWAVWIPFGLTILVCILLIFHVDERISGVKHLQIMFGVPRYLYWLSNYVFDMAVYVGALLGIVLIIVAFQCFMSFHTALLAFVLIMVSFGLAVFPFAYLFHYGPDATSVTHYLSYCYLICSLLLPIAFYMWEERAKKVRQDVRQAVQYTLLLVPHYAVSYGLYLVVPKAAQIRDWESNDQHIQCSIWPHLPCCVPDSQECQDFYNLYHGEISLMYCLLFLLLDAVVYWAIFLYIDYGFLRKSKTIKYQVEDLHSDVVEEARRVNEQIDCN